MVVVLPSQCDSRPEIVSHSYVPSSRFNNSRARLLLGAHMPAAKDSSSRPSLPTKPDWSRYTSGKCAVLTPQELDDLLEFFESSEAEWHQRRGLAPDLAQNKDRLIAITARYSVCHVCRGMRPVECFKQEASLMDTADKKDTVAPVLSLVW